MDPLRRVLSGSRDSDEALAEFAATTDEERHVERWLADLIRHAIFAARRPAGAEH